MAKQRAQETLDVLQRLKTDQQWYSWQERDGAFQGDWQFTLNAQWTTEQVFNVVMKAAEGISVGGTTGNSGPVSLRCRYLTEMFNDSFLNRRR
jgi:hypothetical protein